LVSIPESIDKSNEYENDKNDENTRVPIISISKTTIRPKLQPKEE